MFLISLILHVRLVPFSRHNRKGTIFFSFIKFILIQAI